MSGALHDAAADTASIIAGDNIGGASALHLVVTAAAPALPGAQAEALVFLARRLEEPATELWSDLLHLTAPVPRRKRVVA